MKYICEYQIPVKNNEGRYFALSACDKASYIHSVLNRIGYTVEIISPSFSKKTSRRRTDIISSKVTLLSGFSLGWVGPLTRVFSRLSAMLWFFCFLLFECKKGETIIIYHGIQNAPVLVLAKRIKRFKYILEVEEIYSSLQLGKELKWRRWLEKNIIRISDAFIFASKNLEQRCNIYHRPYLIAHGSYIVEPHLSNKIQDGKIHVVYAGLIENKKNAFYSCCIAKYLDKNYVVHIIGYGNEPDISNLKKKIEEQNKTSDCKVQYDGLKRGYEYLSYLQSCHIGICPLSKCSDYQQACFPSKITSYLSNGLFVVTTDNEVLKTSVYSSFLSFVKNDSPEAFAKSIIQTNVQSVLNPSSCIKFEDERVLVELKRLLDSI